MPRNVLFAAKRGKVDFKACPEHLPAVGAETLEDGVVRRDVPADLLGRLGVELGIEGERYVDDAAARGQMICACGSIVRSKRLPPGVWMERISPASAKRLRLR